MNKNLDTTAGTGSASMSLTLSAPFPAPQAIPTTSSTPGRPSFIERFADGPFSEEVVASLREIDNLMTLLKSGTARILAFEKKMKEGTLDAFQCLGGHVAGRDITEPPDIKTVLHAADGTGTFGQAHDIQDALMEIEAYKWGIVLEQPHPQLAHLKDRLTWVVDAMERKDWNSRQILLSLPGMKLSDQIQVLQCIDHKQTDLHNLLRYTKSTIDCYLEKVRGNIQSLVGDWEAHAAGVSREEARKGVEDVFQIFPAGMDKGSLEAAVRRWLSMEILEGTMELRTTIDDFNEWFSGPEWLAHKDEPYRPLIFRGKRVILETLNDSMMEISPILNNRHKRDFGTLLKGKPYLLDVSMRGRTIRSLTSFYQKAAHKPVQVRRGTIGEWSSVMKKLLKFGHTGISQMRREELLILMWESVVEVRKESGVRLGNEHFVLSFKGVRDEWDEKIPPMKITMVEVSQYIADNFAKVKEKRWLAASHSEGQVKQFLT